MVFALSSRSPVVVVSTKALAEHFSDCLFKFTLHSIGRVKNVLHATSNWLAQNAPNTLKRTKKVRWPKVNNTCTKLGYTLQFLQKNVIHIRVDCRKSRSSPSNEIFYHFFHFSSLFLLQISLLLLCKTNSRWWITEIVFFFFFEWEKNRGVTIVHLSLAMAKTRIELTKFFNHKTFAVELIRVTINNIIQIIWCFPQRNRFSSFNSQNPNRCNLLAANWSEIFQKESRINV